MVDTAVCEECGAPRPDGGACRDHFHALLALEWRLGDGAGAREHFVAVATYMLQHPVGSGYTVAAYAELRDAVSDVLEGRARLVDVRARVAPRAAGSVRILRRESEPIPLSRASRYRVTVADVLRAAEAGADYPELVERWARAALHET